MHTGDAHFIQMGGVCHTQWWCTHFPKECEEAEGAFNCQVSECLEEYGTPALVMFMLFPPSSTKIRRFSGIHVGFGCL